MIAYTYLLLLALGQVPSDQVQKLANPQALALSWSDSEDRLQGSVRPPEPRAGDPLEVSVNVGSFEGKPFDGPVTLSLRLAGEKQGDEHTVARGKVNWSQTFRPTEPGDYMLDLAFRTTRLKVIHLPLTVGEAKLARWPWWLMIAGAGIALVVVGVRAALRKPGPAR